MKKLIVVFLIIAASFPAFSKTLDEITTNKNQQEEMINFLKNEIGWKDSLNSAELDWEESYLVGTPIIVCHLKSLFSDHDYLFIPFETDYMQDYFIRQMFSDIRNAYTDDDQSTEAVLGYNGHIIIKTTYEDEVEESFIYIFINADEKRYSTFDFVYEHEIDYSLYMINNMFGEQ